MLLNLREYHRPGNETTISQGQRGLDRALELLARTDIRTVPLAGGDTLLGSADETIEAVVDLQGLGLETVTVDPDNQQLRAGAMTTRAALARHEFTRGSYGGILARGAAAWGGSVQRNRATVGGAIAVAAANDPLLAALLVCDAIVVLRSRDGVRKLPLAEFIPQRRQLMALPALIEAVTVPAQTEATAALVSIGRTPADAPIVLAAAALVVQDGRCTSARLALGGVAEAPVRGVSAEEMLAGQVLDASLIASAAASVAGSVRPDGDFRGSSEYRREMAKVLSERALQQAWMHSG